MLGRPPTPTSLKILNGNPGKRPLNRDEPQLKLAKPRCPEHLDEVAQREWKRVVRILMRMRVLTEADQVMLGIWCQTYSTMIEAQDKLKQAGTLYKTKGGFVQVSPLFGIVNKCVHILSKISSEFGLTPSARVRLNSLPEPKSANKWSEVG
jgi:P27 family predicted phage terminase small subunit